jgi:hypothetical protein
MDDGFNITFKCVGCGEQLFWKDDLREDDVVTCTHCGRNNPTLGELKAAAMEAAKKEAENIIGHPIEWKED